MRICKRMVSAALSLAVCLALATPVLAASAFSDVPESHWAAAEIREAVADGIVNGYEDGTFRPANSVTYAHFAAFLTRAFYSDSLREADRYEAWYAPYFEILSGYGLTSGTRLASGFWNNLADSSIDRYDMAQMMYNIIKPGVSGTPEEVQGIGDWNAIPSGYQDAVAVCYALGLLNGQSDGTFGGGNYMNRAQACVVIERMKRYIEHGSGESSAETPAVSMGTLANGKAPTEENVLEILEELEKEFPEGTPWGSEHSWSSPVMGSGRECAGYAFMISDKIFGTLPKRIVPVGEYDRIRPGDVVHMRQPDGTNIHWYVVSSIPDEEGYYQSTHGNVGGKVSWGGWSAIADIPDYYVVYTRYPTDGPERAFASKEELRPEIRCANCGYLMRAAGSETFDSNGKYGMFDCCSKCNDYYVCEQCLDCAAFRNHVASCQG